MDGPPSYSASRLPSAGQRETETAAGNSRKGGSMTSPSYVFETGRPRHSRCGGRFPRERRRSTRGGLHVSTPLLRHSFLAARRHTASERQSFPIKNERKKKKSRPARGEIAAATSSGGETRVGTRHRPFLAPQQLSALASHAKRNVHFQNTRAPKSVFKCGGQSVTTEWTQQHAEFEHDAKRESSWCVGDVAETERDAFNSRSSVTHEFVSVTGERLLKVTRRAAHAQQLRLC
ncbi:hypothetical protein MRX96_037450 [Rhipicephalus microplus]